MEHIYEQIVNALVNDGYGIIPDALSIELNRSLREAVTQEYNFKQAGIAPSTTVHIDPNRRRDKIAWLDRDGKASQEYLDFAQGLQEYLNRTLYLGLRYYEAHFARYEAGDFYEKHLDAFKHSKNRVVTTVYYLNDNWQQGDGGMLCLYDKEDNLLEEIAPINNTLVVFLSEKFPHEVRPSCATRYSIAGWFRVDKL